MRLRGLRHLRGPPLRQRELPCLHQRGVLRLCRRRLRQPHRLRRDDQRTAPCIHERQNPRLKELRSRVNPQRRILARGRNVHNRMVELRHPRQRRIGIPPWTSCKQRQVRGNSRLPQHRYQQRRLVLAVTVVPLNHLGGPHRRQPRRAELHARVPHLFMQPRDDRLDARHPLRRQRRRQNRLRVFSHRQRLRDRRIRRRHRLPRRTGRKLHHRIVRSIGGKIDVRTVRRRQRGRLIHHVPPPAALAALHVQPRQQMNRIVERSRHGQVHDHPLTRHRNALPERVPVLTAARKVRRLLRDRLLLLDNRAHRNPRQRRPPHMLRGVGLHIVALHRSVGHCLLVELHKPAVAFEHPRLQIGGLLKPRVPLRRHLRPPIHRVLRVHPEDQPVGVGQRPIVRDLVDALFIQHLHAVVMAHRHRSRGRAQIIRAGAERRHRPRRLACTLRAQHRAETHNGNKNNL